VVGIEGGNMGIVAKTRAELNASVRMAMEQARLAPNKERAMDRIQRWIDSELRPDRRCRVDAAFKERVRDLWRWHGWKAPTIAAHLRCGKRAVYKALREMGMMPEAVHRAPRIGEGRPRKRTGYNWRTRV
jgi:hypothetical protein